MEAVKNAPSDLKDRLKASYDAMAPQYNAWTVRHHSLRLKYLEKLIELCPQLLGDASADRAPHVVELGCGAGVPILNTLLDKNKDLTITALDLSDTQIDLARENLKAYDPRITFIAGDMVKDTTHIAASSCTAVIALYSLIHLAQDEQVVMIKRIADWLEKDGCVLACFGKDETDGIVMPKWLDEKGWMYWSGHGVEGTVKLFEEAGLKLEVKEVQEGKDETFLWVIGRK
ncbi:S-adenosyl-L-methionine-dependent methyltransferase [Sarocladium strictum]